MSNPLCQSEVVIETKMTTIMTTNQQLELGFNGTQSRILGRRRETRVARAHWWFAQMRAAVAGAMDWPAGGQPRAEQIAFQGGTPEMKAS
jgi:hypothetical protein